MTELEFDNDPIEKLDEQFSTASIEQDLQNLDKFRTVNEEIIVEPKQQTSSFPPQKDHEGKKQILGYLKIVKGKIGELEKKLENESREADYY